MAKNIYDLVADEIEGLVSVQYSLPTFQRIRTWLAAIEDIKPDWKQAPTWAQWWAVDANGTAWWHEFEPKLYSRQWFQEGQCYEARFVALPEGCDWRVMCYEREVEV